MGGAVTQQMRRAAVVDTERPLGEEQRQLERHAVVPFVVNGEMAGVGGQCVVVAQDVLQVRRGGLPLEVRVHPKAVVAHDSGARDGEEDERRDGPRPAGNAGNGTHGHEPNRIVACHRAIQTSSFLSVCPVLT